MKHAKLLISFFLFFCSIEQSVTEFTMSVNSLLELKTSFGKQINENDKEFTPNCTLLLIRGINYSSKLRNELGHQMEKFLQQQNVTKETFQIQFKEHYDSLPEEINPNYEKFLNAAMKDMRENRKAVNNAWRENKFLDEKLRLFKLRMLPDTDDSSSCELDNELGKKLIRILNEVHHQTVGGNFDGDSGTLIRIMAKNIGDYVARRKETEGDIFDLIDRQSKDWDELFRLIMKHIEEGSRDFNNLIFEFKNTRELLQNCQNENEVTRKKIPEKAYNFVVKMIKDGKYFWEASEALEEAEKFRKEPYESALLDAYDCDAANLPNVIYFAQFKRVSGVRTIKTKMEECDHLMEPIFLKVAHILKNEDLKNSVDNIYAKFAKQIREQNLAEVLQTMKELNKNMIDVEKLIRMSYDRKSSNFGNVSKFIDQIEMTKNLEECLYDEMMKSGHIDTVEHVMFAFWLTKRISKVDKMPDQQDLYVQTRLKNLEELKLRIPEGIRNLFFEQNFMLASTKFDTDGYSMLLKVPGDSTSTKFIAVPSNEGRYFWLRDYYHKKILYLDNQDKQVVLKARAGKQTENNEIYWEITPKANSTAFIVRNYSHNRYLTSQTYEVCTGWRRKNWAPWNWECRRSEKFNLAVKTARNWNDILWKITTRILKKPTPAPIPGRNGRFFTAHNPLDTQDNFVWY